MSIKAAKIRDGQEIGRFLYDGDPNDLPITKSQVTIVRVVEEREEPDAYHSVSGPVTTIEADRVIDTWTKAPRSVEETRPKALATVDTDAEAARLRFITGGAGQALVYERKRDEATRWQALVAAQGTPDPADYPMLKSRAERLNEQSPDYQAVADEWTAVAGAWLQVAAAIEAIREGAKEAIEAAADTPAVLAILAGLAWPTPEQQ